MLRIEGRCYRRTCLCRSIEGKDWTIPSPCSHRIYCRRFHLNNFGRNSGRLCKPRSLHHHSSPRCRDNREWLPDCPRKLCNQLQSQGRFCTGARRQRSDMYLAHRRICRHRGSCHQCPRFLSAIDGRWLCCMSGILFGLSLSRWCMCNGRFRRLLTSRHRSIVRCRGRCGCWGGIPSYWRRSRMCIGLQCCYR